MKRQTAFLILLIGGLPLLAGCDTSAESVTEQLRMFAEEFLRNALAALLI
ncbi:MAG: hypothetical protein IT450_09505 [Phycisphaerales bacterium]|nr:hypothetical protein [Phycisphaerales bacterium]